MFVLFITLLKVADTDMSNKTSKSWLQLFRKWKRRPQFSEYKLEQLQWCSRGRTIGPKIVWERSLPRWCGNPCLWDKHFLPRFSSQLQPSDKTWRKVYANLQLLRPKSCKILLECPNWEEEPIKENFRRYGNTDYSAMNELLEQSDFTPKCYTDINQ